VTIDPTLTPADLLPAADGAFALAAGKVRALHARWNATGGAPVFTVGGRYTARGWTEWTQGFQFGAAILAFDATGDADLLEVGRRGTVGAMATHVSHTGVHDHAFNNLSTYGNLRRLMREGRIAGDPWERNFYELAIKVSGAVQAARWSPCAGGGGGYVYSFNGPHSLFVDTMRTLRVLALAHQLGHVLTGENDARVNLLDRAVRHALTTAEYIVFRGDSGHAYDVRGRTAHEAVFNRNDGRFRCRATQQGYSPFSTWTRGVAWAMLGFAELLEFLRTAGEAAFIGVTAGGYREVCAAFECTARATCDHYLDGCAADDGVPYWDDGAPGLARLADWRGRPADPFNDHEPVDSSAAAIAAQGLIRLGACLGPADGARYGQAGLTVARTLLAEPYLSTDASHEGLLLHSVYHRPNGWDHVPPGRKVPCGESSMWGDYHVLELALMIRRAARGEPAYVFFDRAG
jgi:unsaturated chondroitin disaccharide hydrolase